MVDILDGVEEAGGQWDATRSASARITEKLKQLLCKGGVETRISSDASHFSSCMQSPQEYTSFLIYLFLFFFIIYFWLCWVFVSV